MNWHNSITETYSIAPKQPGIATKPAFYPGVSIEDITDLEIRLNAELPSSLRSLLLATNGVMNLMSIDSGEWFEESWLLWTTSEIVERNLWYRGKSGKKCYCRDFSKVVFFANAGSDGILFGFPVKEDYACASNILVWHPIGDELQDIASSLDDFIRKWLTSTIWV